MARDLLASTADDSLALRVLDIIRRRRLLAIGTFAAVLAAAISFAIYLPDLYRGQALVLIERPVDESIVRSSESAPGCSMPPRKRCAGRSGQSRSPATL